MKPKLLIMDDERDFGSYLGEVAKPLGFDVTLLDRSERFKEIYRQLNPDIMIIDIVMPNIDGIELIEWLAEIDNKAPVIVVTGFNPHFALSATSLANSKGQFTVASMTKPVRPKHLSEVLCELAGIESDQFD